MAHEYIGLKNLGATCYLNSLLQSLFMTPDFRQALFSWENQPGNSLASELRRLFGRMQLLASADTAGVIKALEWGAFGNYRQHDAQEFFGVLFDRLENQSPSLWREIEPLYKLHAEDYVRCSHCLRVSLRESHMIDLPLSVPEHDSLPSAIASFLATESMAGEDQYFCEHCGTKRDAERGSRIRKLPLVLNFTLKRFQFSSEESHAGDLRRRKLNDRMSFPLVLDMNEFVSSGNSKSLERRDSQSLPVLALDACVAQKERYLSDRGPEVYELFAVLVHSGNAQGGHYYTLVNDLEKSRWLCFDDDVVTELNSTERLERVWGGDCAANAYILMYRRVGTQASFPESVPLDIQAEVEAQLEAAKKLEEERLRKKITRVLIRRMENFDEKFEVEVDPEETVGRLMEKCLAKAGKWDIPINRARLRRFKPLTKTWTSQVLQTFADPSNVPSHKTFLALSGFSKTNLRLDPHFDESTRLKNTFIFNTGISRAGLLCELVLELFEEGVPASPSFKGHRLIFAYHWNSTLRKPDPNRLCAWIGDSPQIPTVVVRSGIYRAIFNEMGTPPQWKLFRTPSAESRGFVSITAPVELPPLVSIAEGESIIFAEASEATQVEEYVSASETFIKVSYNSEPAEGEFPTLDKFIEVSPDMEIKQLIGMLAESGVEARLLPAERSAVVKRARQTGELLKGGKVGEYVNERLRSKREADIVLWRE